MELEHVGPALRHLRQRRGWKQVQLAARSGCTKAQVSAYERGRRLPWLTTLAKLLDALEASPRDFVRAGEYVKRHPSAE
jgi:transcriptional regulator with XRE-family HTH domain